jgi:hypothetical protein
MHARTLGGRHAIAANCRAALADAIEEWAFGTNLATSKPSSFSLFAPRADAESPGDAGRGLSIREASIFTFRHVCSSLRVTRVLRHGGPGRGRVRSG